ncbi:MAG TPA: DUF2339 domain-containing protein [Vicinamibacterales bacterium]
MPTIIAIVVGGVIGAVWGGSFGAVAGAALAWLLMRSFRLEKQLASLRQALDAAEKRWSISQRVPVAPPPIATSAVTSVPPPVTVTPRSTPPEPPTDTSPVVRPVPPSAPRRVEAPARLFPDAAGAEDSDELSRLMGWLLGGNTIVKVGIGILFIGLAFLAKYASEHVQVPVEVRLSSIGGAALVLLAIGWRLRERRPGYAQTLQGGAVAVLYLTLFVAFRFYGVLAVGPVFGLMVMVAVLAAALAVLQDAPSLAVIGALGGFATPLLVSTGTGNYVALFSYYLVLDLGIAAVAWYRTWRALNLIGFLFTFLVGTAWGVLQYQQSHYQASQTFLATFFLVFVAITLMPARQQPAAVPAGRADGWVNGTLLFGVPTVTFALQYGLVRNTASGVALSALALAAFYVLLAAWMRARPHLAVVFEGSLAIGTVFLTLTIPFALDARSTAGAWALEGAGLVWLGFRQTRPLGRVFGYGLLLLAGGVLLVTAAVGAAPTRMLDATLLNALLVAASSIAGAWFVQRSADRTTTSSWFDADVERAAEPVLIGWATLWLAFAAYVEIGTFVKPEFQLAASLACLSAVALVYAGLSVWLQWRLIATPVIGHAPLLVLGVVASAFLKASPIEAGGWWAWPLALATHLVVLGRAAPQWSAGTRESVHLLGVVVLAALGALQGRSITSDWGESTSAWAWLGWLAFPAGLLLVLPRPATARVWPVSAAPRAYQTDAAGALTFGLLLWAFVANAASNGSAAPLPHVPLLNPLDLGVGVALFAAWRWRESDAARIASAWVPRLAFACMAGDGFIWLNAILIRAFHHYRGVPFHVDAWMASLAVQTGISLLWTVTALVLMWLAARYVLRAPWMAGAALLGAVVLKLLIVDLSGSGTVTRIVSFIGVGVLMLVIGYVAPLPGKGERHEVL